MKIGYIRVSTEDQNTALRKSCRTTSALMNCLSTRPAAKTLTVQS